MNTENITINEQSSIRITGSKVIYFDAFHIENETKDADIIFITHEHFDHYDIESINKIKKNETIVVAPKTMKGKLLQDKVVAENNLTLIEPGESIEIGNVKVKGVPAYNALKPFHPKHNKWLGYVVTIDDVTYYVAGDTDPIKENESIACDIALIPVGGMYTMDYKKAADYASKINPKVVIPTHYGKVVGDPMDGQKFKEALEKLNRSIQIDIKL